jgi:hypothetical protein
MNSFHRLPFMRWLNFAIMASILVFLTVVLKAGPPLITEDPGTPGDGKWEINISSTVQRQPGQSVTEAPLLDMNYGLGDSIELTWQTGWTYLDEKDQTEKNAPDNSLLGV